MNTQYPPQSSKMLYIGAGAAIVVVAALLFFFKPMSPASVAVPSPAPSDVSEPARPITSPTNPTGDSGLPTITMEILKQGSGAVAENGKMVMVNYTGWLTNGTKFDSSLDHGQPFTFQLGAGQVIKGWDQGVLGMKIGEKRKLTIPAEFAYGPDGMPPVIPPNATLVFEVELLGVK